MLYQRSKPYSNLKKSSILAVFFLATALLIATVHPLMPAPVSEVAYRIASPLWSIREGVHQWFTNTHETRATRAELEQYVRTLESELETQRRENFSYRSMVGDTQSTFERNTETGEEFISASVLMDMRSGSLERYGVDRGTADGVRERMLVLTPEGIALGYVERVYEQTSAVTLFSSAGAITPVRVYGDTIFTVLLEGRGAGTMVLTATRDASIATGTIVTLQNNAASPVGEVVDVQMSPEDAFQTVYVRSPVSRFGITDVRIDTASIWESTEDMVRVPSIEIPTEAL